MYRSSFSSIIFLLALSAVLLLMGCGSESGAIVEEPELVAQSYDENCSLCHSAGSIADVEPSHSLESNSPQISVLDVREVNPGGGNVRLEIDFKMVESTNPLIPIFIDESSSSSYGSIRFTLAKLDTGAGGSGSRCRGA